MRCLLPFVALLAALLPACGAREKADVTLLREPGLNVAYLSMNNQAAPFDDVRVRRAVALAVDKRRLIETAYQGQALLATTPVPPTVPGHHDGMAPRAHDPAAARALLQEAGYDLPLEVTLTHANNSRPYMPWPEDVAKQIAGDLEEAGFAVAIRKQEWARYLDIVQNGEHQLALLGWSADIADADNFLYVLLDRDNARKGSANNISFYTSEAVHDLLLRARRTYDAEERERLYREAQEVIDRDVPMVPLVYTEKTLAHRNAVGPLAIEPVMHPLLRLVERPRDGRLRYVRGSDSVTLDAADATDGESSKVIEQIYDTLVRFRPGGIEVEPALAVSWTSDDEHRTWTFRLREGVHFHDGTPVDVAAVVNAFERQRDPAHPHHFPGHKWAYWQDLFGFVERVEPGDEPGTVRFLCSEPAPSFFLALLATFSQGIPSPKALDEHGAAFGRNPVGSGPFRFVRWNPDSEIVLARNAAYWDGAPALAEVVFQPSEKSEVRTMRLLGGEADVIDNLDPVSLLRLPEE